MMQWNVDAVTRLTRVRMPLQVWCGAKLFEGR